jgi:hypothetical protein
LSSFYSLLGVLWCSFIPIIRSSSPHRFVRHPPVHSSLVFPFVRLEVS